MRRMALGRGISGIVSYDTTGGKGGGQGHCETELVILSHSFVLYFARVTVRKSCITGMSKMSHAEYIS